MSRSWVLVSLLFVTGVVRAQEVSETPTEPEAQQSATEDQGPKLLDGMSVLGNQEAPKSLVIVPWKSSELGDSLGLATTLDDSRQPVDRDVFLRELSYYEIRSEDTRDAAQPVTTTHRSKS